jgi:hypothetical protein
VLAGRPSSKHRVYTDEDLDLLTWVACLSATGNVALRLLPDGVWVSDIEHLQDSIVVGGVRSQWERTMTRTDRTGLGYIRACRSTRLHF